MLEDEAVTRCEGVLEDVSLSYPEDVRIPDGEEGKRASESSLPFLAVSSVEPRELNHDP
jgi:hypothetical protein